MVPLKYLSNFWGTLEMRLINCKISLRLKWSKNCIKVAGTANIQNPTLQINDTKLYVSVVTLFTQENIKLLKQIESGFKITIHWNKYLSKTINQARNRYLDYLIDTSLSQDYHNSYYLPTVEIKDYNVMIDGGKFFDQPIKNDFKTYNNIRKIATGQDDDCTTGCLLYYPCFKKYYKLIATDLSKQQKLDSDPIAKQQINFTGNLDRAEDLTMFFIIEEGKETGLDFSEGTVKFYDSISF